jgi:prepilin-type N-terminal cleavage/methylation domain-containing protein
MIKRKTGFTLMELIVVMALMGLVMAATSDTFIGLLRTYKQQGKIAETNIEGIIGLELMRQDIETAGFGLPWVIPASVNYNEANTGAEYAAYNDSPSSPPRPMMSDKNYTAGGSGFPISTTNGYAFSDLLVIKSANVTRNATAQRWTYLQTTGIKQWLLASGNPAPENPKTTDYVIVLSPGASDADRRTLVLNGTSWNTIFSSISNFYPGAMDPQPRYVYGISDVASRMPFNRADYYIAPPSTVDVPQRCASNTGVLVKSMINHSNGSRSDYLPLLDCVADMKVIFHIDALGNGTMTITDDISTLTAEQIRTQVKEVRVYILAHQGQMDKSYTHPQSTIAVGESPYQHNFNIGMFIHYRWKVYTIVVEPKNMVQ